MAPPALLVTRPGPLRLSKLGGSTGARLARQHGPKTLLGGFLIKSIPSSQSCRLNSDEQEVNKRQNSTKSRLGYKRRALPDRALFARMEIGRSQTPW